MEREASIRTLTLEERELVMMVELSDLLDEDAHAEYQPMHYQFMRSLMGSEPASLFHEDVMILRYCKYFRTLFNTNPREKLFYNVTKNFFNNVTKN